MFITRRQVLSALGSSVLLPRLMPSAMLASQAPAVRGGQQQPKQSEEIHNLGSRLELLVDDWLIERKHGVELLLHHPTPREVAIAFDKPWEGNTSAYVTVFPDGDLFRMYYRGSRYDWATNTEDPRFLTCYAESKDGIHWTKPELNLCEFEGSTRNNIVWRGAGRGHGNHNFAPFKDGNPNCKPEARYKALGGDYGVGLFAFQSPDGLHWSQMRPEPVLTKGQGHYDSQNLGFWDAVRGHYVVLYRKSRKYQGQDYRDIMTSTSDDFVHWTEPQWLDYGDATWEHLYTNAVTPYFRAPHILLGFPMRFHQERKPPVDNPEPGVSDGVFMTSRDGLHWHRWLEAFIRPGLQRERWWQRNNMTAWGILVTKAEIAGLPDELSLYSVENYYAATGSCRMRRYTLRMDGFVSVHAPFAGGEFVTHPLVFEGKQLAINYSTSAAGSVRVELQDAAGKPIEGFTLADSAEMYGDEIEHVVNWKGGPDVGRLAGKPVRLRVAMKDADLYALRFRLP